MKFKNIIDGHCDTVTILEEQNRSLGEISVSGQLDLPRMRMAGVNVQFFAVFVHPKYKDVALRKCLYYIDKFYNELQDNKDIIELARSKEDILRITGNNKIAALLAVEGGEPLSGDLAILRILYRLGVRSLTLTWNARNELGDGVWEGASGGGLSKFGRSVVCEMNRLGILIDVSHLNEKGFWDVAETSAQPFAATHSNCRYLCNHPRNLNDDQIRHIAKTGGLIGLTFVPDFVHSNQPSLEMFLQHVDHVASLAGTECIGLGSDFDGMEVPVKGLEDVSCLTVLADALYKRGYKTEDISGIMGENWLRLLKQIL